MVVGWSMRSYIRHPDEGMQAIGHTAVIALLANQPQASYIAKPSCPGSYTDLYNQCSASRMKEEKAKWQSNSN